MEEFRIINGYENYSVSNFGNVRNNTTGKILKATLNVKGYYIVKLYKDGEKTIKSVHRLVGVAFLENPLNKKIIDHINNIKTDNRVENLRWCSQQENCMNSSKPKNNTSGSKGVYWNKKINKWLASISIDGKLKHLGYFDKKVDAINARVNKAKEIYGEFMNNCEQIKDELTELKNEKQKEFDEIEALERELNEILKTK